MKVFIDEWPTSDLRTCLTVYDFFTVDGEWKAGSRSTTAFNAIVIDWKSVTRTLSISIDSGHPNKKPLDGLMKLVNEIDKSRAMIGSDLLNNPRSVLEQWIDFSIVSRYRITIIRTMTMYRTVSIMTRSFQARCVVCSRQRQGPQWTTCHPTWNASSCRRSNTTVPSRSLRWQYRCDRSRTSQLAAIIV